MNKTNNSIKEEYQNQINELENNYDSFQNLLISEAEKKIKALKSELPKFIEEELAKKNENIDNKEVFQEDDIFKQIEDEINEIKNDIQFHKIDKKENENNNKFGGEIDMDTKLREFKHIYKTENSGLSDNDLKKILLDCNCDFFNACFLLIKKSYETK